MLYTYACMATVHGHLKFVRAPRCRPQIPYAHAIPWGRVPNTHATPKHNCASVCSGVRKWRPLARNPTHLASLGKNWEPRRSTRLATAVMRAAMPASTPWPKGGAAADGSWPTVSPMMAPAHGGICKGLFACMRCVCAVLPCSSGIMPTCVHCTVLRAPCVPCLLPVLQPRLHTMARAAGLVQHKKQDSLIHLLMQLCRPRHTMQRALSHLHTHKLQQACMHSSSHPCKIQVHFALPPQSHQVPLLYVM